MFHFLRTSGFFLQTGPKAGRDKVKKGGSFMCHKVREAVLLVKSS